MSNPASFSDNDDTYSLLRSRIVVGSISPRTAAVIIYSLSEQRAVI